MENVSGVYRAANGISRGLIVPLRTAVRQRLFHLAVPRQGPKPNKGRHSDCDKAFKVLLVQHPVSWVCMCVCGRVCGQC